MADDRAKLLEILRRGMHRAEGEPFTLASGAKSWEVFDAAEAICDKDTLGFVVSYLLDRVDVEYDAIGGPALGAGPMAYAAGALKGCRSFLVRPQKKGHGIGGLVKGRFEPGDRILVVDDVVTTGGSLLKAMRAIRDEGGEIVGAATLVDRSDATAQGIADEFGVPYFPLSTYADYGIEPVELAVSGSG